MCRNELMEKLEMLRKKMDEGKSLFRTDVQLTNSYLNPTPVLRVLTMIVGSLMEGKSLETSSWIIVKRSINPHEEFRQKVLKYNVNSMNTSTFEMISKMMEENKVLLEKNNVCAVATELHYLLLEWLHVVLKLKELCMQSEERIQKQMFQTTHVSDVSILSNPLDNDN